MSTPPVTEPTLDFRVVLAASVCAARMASKAVLGIKADDLSVRTKTQLAEKGGMDDHVTKADFLAQHTILHVLRHTVHKDLPIIAEEDESETKEALGCKHGVPIVLPDLTETLREVSSRVPESLHCVPMSRVAVCIDPIDGTNQLTSGHPERCVVLIGASVDGRATMGVCHRPWGKDTDNLCWGVVGGGFHVPNLHPSPALDSDDFTVVLSESSQNRWLTAAVDSLRAKRSLRVGGAGNKAVMVATGDASCYVTVSGTKVWDTCAPEAIITATGGGAVRFSGEPVYYRLDEPPEQKDIVFYGPGIPIDEVRRRLYAIPASVSPDGYNST